MITRRQKLIKVLVRTASLQQQRAADALSRANDVHARQAREAYLSQAALSNSLDQARTSSGEVLNLSLHQVARDHLMYCAIRNFQAQGELSRTADELDAASKAVAAISVRLGRLEELDAEETRILLSQEHSGAQSMADETMINLRTSS